MAHRSLSSKGSGTAAGPIAVLLSMLALLAIGIGTAIAAERTIAFDIPASPAHHGLNLFAEQAGIQLIYPFDAVKDLRVNRVQGNYTLEEGLRRLISGTCLQLGARRGDHLTLNIDDDNARFWFMRQNKNGCKPQGFFAALSSSLSAAIIAAVTTPPASAQTPPVSRTVLEEVVVTARKREESLQRVPVAVSVVNREVLQNGVANDLSKIGELVPQVSLSQGGSGTGAVITVRGVSSASNDAGLDQSVAIEIDGVPISRGQVMSAALFDIDQVQVLQGPQALFFGKNSPAGVISLRSANPTELFEAYLKLGYEFEAKERFGEGAVSGPLTETLTARLAARVSEMDGWIRNVAAPTPDLVNPAFTAPGAVMGRTGPDNEYKAGRLTLRWTPRDDFDATLKLMTNTQQRNAGNASTEPFCVGATTAPVLRGTVPIPGGDCRKDRRKSHGAVAPEYAVNIPYANGGVPYFDSDFDFASLNLDKQWNALTLNATTGFYGQTVKQMNVSDWSPFATIWAASRENYELWTQELRLSSQFDGPLNFMAGLYYEEFERDFLNSADLGHAFNPVAQNYASNTINAKTSGDYLSAFGQLSWNIRSDLELAVGARYSRDEKESDIVNLANNPSFPGLYPLGRVLTSRFSDSNVSPETTLSWYLAEQHTLYAAYKTGYKAGGISNPFLLFASATPENVKFEPEEAKGFEIGYKGDLLDSRLRVDAVAYSYDYKDLQVVSYNSETISFTINNAASAEIRGVQGAFEWLVLDTLSLRGNLGYNRAEYDRFPNAQCYPGQSAVQGCVGRLQDLKGKALLRAPRLTYSLGADYYPALIDGWNTTLSLQASYSGSFETATDNAPAGHQESYWLLNAALRLSPRNERFEVALVGRNLTDEYYMLNSNGWSGSGNPNQQVGFFNRPREVVLEGTVRF
jgi:outer membrane receptor protein involved in Fe transport